MVVDYIKRKENILPIAFGIIFLLLYYKLALNDFLILLFAFIALLAIVRDIRIGIILAIFMLPFTDYALNLIYMAFLVIIYLYQLVFKGVQPLRKEAIDIPLVLFIILILISTITSVSPYGSFRDLAFHLTAIGFVFVLVTSIRSKEDFNILVTFIVIAATLVGILGLLQYIEGIPMDEGWVDLVSNPGVNIRIYSAFDNPNILAEYLVMIIPISIALFWYSKSISKKFLFFMTSMILLLSLMLTLSRGGWLGLFFALLVFAFFIEKRLLLLILPLALAMVYLLPERIFDRVISISDLEDSSNLARINLWKLALDVIQDNWLIGVGFGYIPFKMVYELYDSSARTFYHVHNTYLQILGEMGLVGFIIFALFIFVLFKYSIKRLIKGEDRYIKTMAAGLLAGLAGLSLHGMVENILYMPKIIITFWLIVGLIISLMRIAGEEEKA